MAALVSSTGVSPACPAASKAVRRPLDEVRKLRWRHHELAVLGRPDQRVGERRLPVRRERDHRDVAGRADMGVADLAREPRRGRGRPMPEWRGVARRTLPAGLQGWSRDRGSIRARPAASAAPAARRRPRSATGSAPTTSFCCSRGSSSSSFCVSANESSSAIVCLMISVRCVVSTLGGIDDGAAAQRRFVARGLCRSRARGGRRPAPVSRSPGISGDAAARVHREQHASAATRRAPPRSP